MSNDPVGGGNTPGNTGPGQPGAGKPGAGKPSPKRTPVKLELPADLVAHYVNFAIITHTMSEVMVDYAQVLPNTPKARVLSRVILSPTNAKQLHKALGDMIKKYESSYGEIKVPPSLADRLFTAARTVSGGDTSDETDEADDE
jgi:hypothetical protein